MKESVLMNLCNIHRFSNQHFIVPDKDSDHTIRMQLYVLEMYNSLGAIVPVKDLCYRCLVHDVDEVIAADIPRNIKYYDDNIHSEIERVTIELLSDSGIDDYLIEDITTAKHRGDYWDGVICFLDTYDAVCKLLTEYNIQKSERIKSCLFESLSNLTKVMTDKISNQEGSSLEYIEKYLKDAYGKLKDEINSCMC